MAVPKRRVSKARRDKRRSNVWKMEAPALVKCPQCGEYKRAHRVCSACGYYNGKLVVCINDDVEIRKDNKPYAGWNDPKLTPSKETLRSMKAAGYRLYVDGKLQR